MRKPNCPSSLPQYPYGWFLVARSEGLKPNTVTSARYFGQELAVFRTEEGRAVVLDAHCAHLGANLAKGGRVCGETIECPFHRWGYGRDGHCVRIPYAAKVPPGARVYSWPVWEADGAVMLSNFDDHGPTPKWGMPPLFNHPQREWTPWAEMRWKIRARTQDVFENDLDLQHLEMVHDGLRAELISIVEKEAMLESRLRLQTDEGEEGSLIRRNYGLGVSVTYTNIAGVLSCNLTSVTPIDEDHVDLRLILSTNAPENAPTLLQKARRVFEQDIAILENKICLARPLLCAEEGAIGVFRKWSKQFYSSAEPTQEASALETSLARNEQTS